MTTTPAESDRENDPRHEVEDLILDDERRRSGEFLRDFLARNCAVVQKPTD